MDPVTATIVWGVVWFFLIGAGSLIVWASMFLGLWLGDERGMAIGTFVGWVLGLAWAAFSTIQVFIHIVDLVRHLSG